MKLQILKVGYKMCKKRSLLKSLVKNEVNSLKVKKKAGHKYVIVHWKASLPT